MSGRDHALSCRRRPTHADSLEQFDGLSSEAGEARVQHEVHQGDHGVHVGSEGAQGGT